MIELKGKRRERERGGKGQEGEGGKEKAALNKPGPSNSFSK